MSDTVSEYETTSYFNEEKFRQSVRRALKDVERILESDRKLLPPNKIRHLYDNKYEWVDFLTNTCIIALLNVLHEIGITKDLITDFKKDSTSPTILRFAARDSCFFLRESEVKVDESIITTESNALFGKKSKTVKEVEVVTEYHWKVEIQWQIYLVSGENLQKVLQSRESSTTIVVQDSNQPPLPQTTTHKPFDLNITWLLDQIDTETWTSQFSIHRHAAKTPCRNFELEQAIEFCTQMLHWALYAPTYFTKRMFQLHTRHNPAIPHFSDENIDSSIASSTTTNVSNTYDIRNDKDLYATLRTIHIFCPIVPLMDAAATPTTKERLKKAEQEDLIDQAKIATFRDETESHINSPLLSNIDMIKILNEQVKSMEQVKMVQIFKMFGSSNDTTELISRMEANIGVLCVHVQVTIAKYFQCVDHVEYMIYRQLVSAIGKSITDTDFYQFVKYYNHKLLYPDHHPKSFCYAIRRPNRYPDGVISIEELPQEVVANYVNEIDTLVQPIISDYPTCIPITSSTKAQLTGKKYLHGWLNHRFGEATSNECFQLCARARQFSSFIVVIGTMAPKGDIDEYLLQPKHAIIVQNKDEVLIPLLLEELPTSQEFKDAIQSLSPEQQDFATEFRKMQLSSTVFGMCIIQIKPQLEKLLGLPPNALAKEMKLTQDLMELFVNYNIPSDIISCYDPSNQLSRKEKVEHVREHVQNVYEVVKNTKEKQLKEEQRKAEMRYDMTDKGNPTTSDDDDLSPDDGEVKKSKKKFKVKLKKKSKHKRSRSSSDSKALAAVQYDVVSESPSKPVQEITVQSSSAVAASPLPESTPKAQNEQVSRQLTGTPTPTSIPPTSTSATPTLPVLPTLPTPPIPSTTTTSNDPGPTTDLTSPTTDPTGTTEPTAQDDQGEKRESIILQEQLEVPNNIDVTTIPKLLDTRLETHDNDESIRPTIITANDSSWQRTRQENLLTKPTTTMLNAEDIKSERNKAFDLLEALSRSGTLAIDCSELHVIIALTHCFDRDVIGTVIQDNINPIEKLEKSTLMLASTIYGVSVKELIHDNTVQQRLELSYPDLFDETAVAL